MKKWIILFLIIILYAKQKNDNTCYIEQTKITNLSFEYSNEITDQTLTKLGKHTLTIIAGDKKITCSLEELGLTIDEEDLKRKIVLLKLSRPLYRILFDQWDEDININLAYKVNQKKLESFIKGGLKDYNTPAKNARCIRANGKFTYIEERDGHAIVLDQTIDTINLLLNEWDKSDINITAKTSTIKPSYTITDIQKCKDLIGSYTTYFSSSEGRVNNIKTGADYINGIILYPGDYFSAYEVLSPFSIENGYDIASAFENGDVVDAIGGGVCQLTTTLYNAVLAAELKIVERHEHSLQVSYIDVSRDATVASKFKDFRFQNDTNNIIYIEGLVTRDSITFNVWGYETRDKSRKIEFEVKKIRYLSPDSEEVIIDEEKPSTYKHIRRNSRYGCEAELYKIVYIDDMEVDRVLINKSIYEPLPAIVVVGKGGSR